MNFILTATDDLDLLRKLGGGKAANLAFLSRNGFPVPDWFCISIAAFQEFVKQNDIQKELIVEGNLGKCSEKVENFFLSGNFPGSLMEAVLAQLEERSLLDDFVAVRSSGLDEDSPEYSFAGQFSSYLFQKGETAIEEAIRKCWASGFSERVLAYRMEHGLPVRDIQVGVVVQRMVNAEVAGVAFSRNPIKPLDRDHLIISSAWGLGEGVVSGELDADHFEVHRKTGEVEPFIVEKRFALLQAPEGGLIRKDVKDVDREKSSLTDAQIREVAKLATDLEKKLKRPQDCEWAYEQGQLFCVQTRPITSLPPETFFSPSIKGNEPILWDNSNIIESYCGVTSPLTYTFAVRAYQQVYRQFCEVMGVPEDMIVSHESTFRNLLGLLRGRIYYNLINWYRLALILPGASRNQGFLETMMGVKQTLKPELASLFDFMKNPPKYSFWKRISVTAVTVYRFIRMDRIVEDFLSHFDAVYQPARKKDFSKMPLPQQAEYYLYLDREILTRWQAPIINDYLCMIFFGVLKKLTEKWLAEGDQGSSLQNDLLCGEGDLESTEPTKMLMRIAESIDKGDPEIRQWFVSTNPEQIWEALTAGHRAPDLLARFREFLDRYGFRCINELKLEEPDLHDDPSFIIQAVCAYVRTKNYSIEAMEKREIEIRSQAEKQVRGRLSGFKRLVYFWILKQARRVVGIRENLRFSRTKIFGVIRHLFRAMGQNLVDLGLLRDAQDIFYLTVDEIFSFIEGRAVTIDLEQLVDQRKKEYDHYRKTPAPPDRLLTYGAAGASVRYLPVLSDADLLRSESPTTDDPNLLTGTPCCPGIVEGVVRVVNDMKDAAGLEDEILVTERTDPGWVPLYPSCSGLLIERGSLLSHSAVVARELGLPTIVGISGGLLKKLKTGQQVHMDAGKGIVRILDGKGT